MRVPARFALLALLACLSAGCLTSETLIRLNADRSGTVEQVVLINARALEMLPRMMGDMLGGDVKMSPSKPGSAPDMFDEAQLRADAARLGEGVRFESVERLERGDLQGARIIYRFDDANALVVDQEPASGALGNATATSGGPGAFAFDVTPQPDGNTLLTVRFAEPSAGKVPSGKSSGSSKGGMPKGMEDVIKEMFAGFRVSVDVEVNGSIVSTSSPFVDGARVTVLELDLGKLLKNRDGLDALERVTPGASVGEMVLLLKDVAGIKVNQSPLTILFAGR